MNKLIRSLTSLSYCVGFFDEKYLTADKATRYSQVAWLDTGTYRDGWFADPFFCDIHGDVIRLFVEEFRPARGRGRISLLEVERKGSRFLLTGVRPVLELGTHLSFPYVFRSGGTTYVLPENHKSGKVTLYRFDPGSATLTDGRVLAAAPLLDPSLFEMDGKYFLMGTEGSDNRRLADTRLRIYGSDSLDGPFTPVQTIENRKRVERGAGCIFRTDGGSWIRPTQSCEKRYGECVLLQELKYENGQFSERLLSRIEPDEAKPNSYCLHTLNTQDGLCVIDGLSYRYPLLGPALIRLLDRRAQKHAANG